MSGITQRRNWILDTLSGSELTALCSELKPIVLSKDTALFEPGVPAEYIYFPTTAVISFAGDTGDGGTVEVWAVGREGAAGISGILGRTKPFRGTVQVGGNAFMAKAASCRRHFRKSQSFHDALLRYYHHLMVQISYIGICNNWHSIEQRFSRWLLMVHDRVGSSRLKFTQDAIAESLGTRRATISVAAAALQNAGFISYTPGLIRIESRRGLQRAACGCYKVIREFRNSDFGIRI